jgi:hypothetical protein
VKRFGWVIAVLVLGFLPVSHARAGQTASWTFTVTVESSPLLTRVAPDCVFTVGESGQADCTLTIVVAQPTLELRGWKVWLATTAVAEVTTGAPLPGATVALVAAAELAVDGGQPVDAVGGPFVPAFQVNEPLSQNRALIVAKPGYGNGQYTVVTRFRLTVPDGTPAGVYRPTWSVGVSNDAA